MKIIYLILLTLTTLPSYATVAYFNATNFIDIVDQSSTPPIIPEVFASGSLTYHLDSSATLVLDDFSMITHNDTFTFDPLTYGYLQNGVGSAYIGMNVSTESYGQLAFINVQDFVLGFNYDSVTGEPLSFDLLALAVDGGTVAWVSNDVQLSTVPVPGAVWLMGTSILGLLGFSHKRTQISV